METIKIKIQSKVQRLNNKYKDDSYDSYIYLKKKEKKKDNLASATFLSIWRIQRAAARTQTISNSSIKADKCKTGRLCFLHVLIYMIKKTNCATICFCTLSSYVEEVTWTSIPSRSVVVCKVLRDVPVSWFHTTCIIWNCSVWSDGTVSMITWRIHAPLTVLVGTRFYSPQMRTNDKRIRIATTCRQSLWSNFASSRDHLCIWLTRLPRNVNLYSASESRKSSTNPATSKSLSNSASPWPSKCTRCLVFCRPHAPLTSVFFADFSLLSISLLDSSTAFGTSLSVVLVKSLDVIELLDGTCFWGDAELLDGRSSSSMKPISSSWLGLLVKLRSFIPLVTASEQKNLSSLVTVAAMKQMMTVAAMKQSALHFNSFFRHLQTIHLARLHQWRS